MAIGNNGGISISYEVDRQIKETLARRNSLHAEITSVKLSISKHDLFWMRNDEKHIQAKAELSDRLHVLEGMYNAAVYTFRESVTNDFVLLKNRFATLCSTYTKTYDNTPSSRQLMIGYNPKGDMKNIHFSTEPLCLALGNDVFCVIPYYVVHFKSNGDYVTTYSSKAIKGGLVNGSYNEQVRHVTWTHTRVDGRPDMRYKNNPQRVYYTTTTHTVYNMLALSIVNYQLKYEVDDSVKYNLISAIKNYSALVPTKVYDSSYHLLRLLKMCDEDNSNLAKLEKITGVSISKEHLQETTISSSKTNNATTTVQVREPPSKAKLALLIGLAVLCGGWAGLTLILSLAPLTASDWGSFFTFFSISGLLGLGTYLLVSEAVKTNRLRRNLLYEHKRKLSSRVIVILLVAVFNGLLIVGLSRCYTDTVSVNATKESDVSNAEVQETTVEPSQQTTPSIISTTVITTTTEAVPTNEIWATSPTPLECFEYYRRDDTIYLEKYIGDNNKVWIDSEYTIDGETYVVGSEVGSLFSLGDVYSVILPEGITQVSSSIFNSCGVKYIYIPSSLESDDGSSWLHTWYEYLHDVAKVFYGGSEEEWSELTNNEKRSSIDVVQIVYEVTIDELTEQYGQRLGFSNTYGDHQYRPTDICYFKFYINDDKIFLKEYIGESDFVWIDTEYIIDGVTYKVADTLYDLIGLSDATIIVISEGFTVIDEYMFLTCSDLHTLYLPQSLNPNSCGAFYLHFHKDVATIAYGGRQDEWNILTDDTDRISINATEINYDVDYETLKQRLLDVD